MSEWIDDGRGGAYRVVGLLALRVRATDSARRWSVSVEVAPAQRAVVDLGDGHDTAPPVRVVRGREPGRVVVPAQLVSGPQRRAMVEAARLALRLVHETADALGRIV